jgi:hypothetical protein
MRHTIFWLLVFGIATFLFACVDVQDVIDPRFQFVVNSEDGIIKDTYYYGDSISFEVTFTDNSSIVKSEVAIGKESSDPINNPVDITDTVSSWGIYITELADLSGSRFVQRTVNEKIPTIFKGEFLDPGTYFIYLSVEDVGGTFIDFKETFTIVADQTEPTITIDGLGLQKDASDNYEACVGFVVPVDGYVKDNTKIKSLQYRFTRESNTSEFSTSEPQVINSDVPTENDSVYIATIFGEFGVTIPSQIAGVDVESETLLFTVIATDTFNNKSTSTSIPIVVNCDTEIPTVQVLKTTPVLNSNLVFDIPVGGSFSIDSIRFTDISGLGDITLDLRKGSLSVIAQNIGIPAGVVDTTFVDESSFQFIGGTNTGDLFSIIGNIYTLTITATDLESPANVATIRITLNTVEDASPTIEVVDLLINPDNQVIDTIFINVSDGGIFNATDVIVRAEAIPVVSYLIASGKVQDDIGINSIEFIWERPNSTNEPFTPVVENTPTVVQLDDLIPVDLFSFPTNSDGSRLVGDYIFTILIEDTIGNITEVSYIIQID